MNLFVFYYISKKNLCQDVVKTSINMHIKAQWMVNVYEENAEKAAFCIKMKRLYSVVFFTNAVKIAVEILRIRSASIFNTCLS